MFDEALKQAGVEKDDEGALTRAQQLWSFLDNMASSDPKGKVRFNGTGTKSKVDCS